MPEAPRRGGGERGIIPSMTTHRALIIEDSREIADLVRLHLRDVGCEADVAADGRHGLELAARGRYDLVVLDLMLPEMDGLAVCREIRTLPGYVPILMLTAKSSEIDRVLGLEMGADDYLTKPFSVRELQARVKALFRRVEALSSRMPGAGDAGAGETIERGALRIETGKRRVGIDGREVALTAREFDLLVHFARRPRRVHLRPDRGRQHPFRTPPLPRPHHRRRHRGDDDAAVPFQREPAAAAPARPPYRLLWRGPPLAGRHRDGASGIPAAG